METIKGYVRGNIAFPNGVIDRLLMMGGVSVETFKEADLANPVNLFYIDFYNDNVIKYVTDDSVMGLMMIEHWQQYEPFTYIDDPNSLPKSWAEAVLAFDEAQIYNKGQNTELNSKLVKLGELITLRNIYRQGWIPSKDNFCFYIEYDLNNDDLIIMRGIGKNQVLSFQDTDLTEQFYENFKDDILLVKDLI